ncbi:MAG: hypothetical protein J1E36_06085 [Eubacterium sp.]|nr:hypothetical protein [Eubacterium sp.]
MNTNSKKTRSSGNLIAMILILILCMAVSVSLLFSRVIPYTSAKFVNIHSLNENAPIIPDVTDVTTPDGTIKEFKSEDEKHNPEYHMEADEKIFKFSYDETGKVTVIGPEGNEDKLFAPGTSNIYQFTLANTGDVALDYYMEMEAYYEGTDLWIPIEARLWDYNNNYLVGSADEMVDVIELNSVEESGELGAGRNAVYNLEWQWPFERGDDEYDTMLGNLAVDEDLELHIVIRTVAVHDGDPDDPDAGLINPPYTGDSSQLVLLCVLSGGSFAGLCIMIFAFFKSSRKEKEAKE